MERLAFYECCFRYEFTGEVPTESTCKYGNVLLMFDMVKNDLQNDREKAERIAERNAINGARGGRPRKDYNSLREQENPEKPKETQKNPAVFDRNPIHYTTQQNTTTQQAAMGGGSSLDLAFFDEQLWPRLNRSGKFNSRHRACCAKWDGYSSRKKAAIAKAVLSDLFAGSDNPFFYLEDFVEPTPKYLTGKECEEEWHKGRSVYVVRTEDGKFEKVTESDLKEFGLSPVSTMAPQ